MINTNEIKKVGISEYIYKIFEVPMMIMKNISFDNNLDYRFNSDLTSWHTKDCEKNTLFNMNSMSNLLQNHSLRKGSISFFLIPYRLSLYQTLQCHNVNS